MPANSSPPTNHVRWLVTNPVTEVHESDASILVGVLPTADGDGLIAAVGDCSAFPVATAAATLSGIGLGSIAGPPSAWDAPTFVVSNASAGAVEPSGRCIHPTS